VREGTVPEKTPREAERLFSACISRSRLQASTGTSAPSRSQTASVRQLEAWAESDDSVAGPLFTIATAHSAELTANLDRDLAPCFSHRAAASDVLELLQPTTTLPPPSARPYSPHDVSKALLGTPVNHLPGSTATTIRTVTGKSTTARPASGCLPANVYNRLDPRREALACLAETNLPRSPW
jgi:hypothetical protein